MYNAMKFQTSRLRRAGTIALILTGSTAAQAQQAVSCIDLQKAEASIQAQKAKLLGDFPGTAAALFLCDKASQNQQPNDRGPAILACGFVVCMAVGFSTCADLVGRIMEVQSQDEWIKKRKLELGCP